MDVRLLAGDCVERLRELPESSVDCCICDPPYGLEFMGKEWDKLGWQAGGGFSKPGIGERPTMWTSFSSTSRFGATNPTCAKCGGRLRGAKKCSCGEPEWKPIGPRRNPENKGLPDDMAGAGYGSQMHAMQKWHYAWAVEALRVLKPGGYLLAFGGTRTYHRLACAVEDAGFEIRDRFWTPGGWVAGELAWFYGSGFPKSLDVSKAIDRQLGQPREVAGRGAAVDRGALDYGGSSGKAKNGLKAKWDETNPITDEARKWEGWGTALKPAHEPIIVARKPLIGTVAANVLKHGTGGINIDGCRVEGSKGDGVWGTSNEGRNPSETVKFNASPGREHFRSEAIQTKDGQIGRWPANVILDEAAAAMLDEQTGALKSGKPSGIRGRSEHNVAYADIAAGSPLTGYGDTGGASRFFYVAKASKRERNAGLDELEKGKNHHPCVKPIALMRYLIRLVCPPGGTVLDPFLGSGSTGCAAALEPCVGTFIGCELDSDYLAIAEARIAHWQGEAD